jgi:hypothetical protein
MHLWFIPYKYNKLYFYLDKDKIEISGNFITPTKNRNRDLIGAYYKGEITEHVKTLTLIKTSQCIYK